MEKKNKPSHVYVKLMHAHCEATYVYGDKINDFKEKCKENKTEIISTSKQLFQKMEVLSDIGEKVVLDGDKIDNILINSLIDGALIKNKKGKLVQWPGNTPIVIVSRRAHVYNVSE